MSEFRVKVWRIKWSARKKNEPLLCKKKISKKIEVIKQFLRATRTAFLFSHGPHGKDKGYFKIRQSLNDCTLVTCSQFSLFWIIDNPIDVAECSSKKITYKNLYF